jgi:hypothetical protein
VRPEGLGTFKKFTSSGIEPRPSGLYQCLNHYGTVCQLTHVFIWDWSYIYIYIYIYIGSRGLAHFLTHLPILSCSRFAPLPPLLGPGIICENKKRGVFGNAVWQYPSPVPNPPDELYSYSACTSVNNRRSVTREYEYYRSKSIGPSYYRSTRLYNDDFTENGSTYLSFVHKVSKLIY